MNDTTLHISEVVHELTIIGGNQAEVLKASVAPVVEVLEVAAQGPRGVQGEQGEHGEKGDTGDQGPPGTDKHYVHTQSVASDIWTVTHNLGKYPSVTVVDSADSEQIGDVTYLDLNSLTVTFAAAFGGKAYLN